MGVGGWARAYARRSMVALQRDPLTDLPLRGPFLNAVRRDLRDARTDRVTGVLFIDLDGFKRINDTFGHDGGDALLHEVATRVSGAVGARDLAARVGGDEFAVLLRGRESIEAVLASAHDVLAAVGRPLPLPLRALVAEHSVSASVGVAVDVGSAGEVHQDAADLLRAADVAMLAAKRRGGGDVEMSSPTRSAPVDGDPTRDAALLRAVEHAIAHETFDLRYQPVYCVGCGDAVRVEALLRVLGVDGSAYNPGRLLAAAQTSGRLDRITAWVLARAVADASDWWAQGHQVPVSVNISAAELARPSAPAALLSAVRRRDLPARGLVVEVHRTGRFDCSAGLGAGAAGLAVAGVGVVLEDVDTQWPLGDLADVVPQGISIGRESIESATTCPPVAAALDALMHVAGSTGSSVTAKAIETPAQLARAIARGCTLVQGTALSPVTTPDRLAWRTSRLTMRDAKGPLLTEAHRLATVHACTTAFSYADRALAETQRPRDPSSPLGPGGFSRPRAHFDAAEES